MPVSAFILSLFLPLWDFKSIHYIRKFFITNFVIMIKVCRDLIRILPQTQENFAISKFVINKLYCTIYNHLLTISFKQYSVTTTIILRVKISLLWLLFLLFSFGPKLASFSSFMSIHDISPTHTCFRLGNEAFFSMVPLAAQSSF